MKVNRRIPALLAGIVAASACAQSAPQPLNLNLPPDNVSAEGVSSAPSQGENENSVASTVTDASNPPGNPAQLQPGVAYDGPEGMYENPEAYAARKCDDVTYSQPQVHGEVTAGVAGGNHVSGNYQSGVVHASKAFGSCDNPTGGVGISIGVDRGTFNGRRHGWH